MWEATWLQAYVPVACCPETRLTVLSEHWQAGFDVGGDRRLEKGIWGFPAHPSPWHRSGGQEAWQPPVAQSVCSQERPIERSEVIMTLISAVSSGGPWGHRGGGEGSGEAIFPSGNLSCCWQHASALLPRTRPSSLLYPQHVLPTSFTTWLWH